jgi:tetratricopeptide (TPR) repeat protein
MKFFGRKTAGQAVSRQHPPALPPGDGFYSKQDGEPPLDDRPESSAGPVDGRTSRHHSGRQENSNRAGRRAIGFLLLRGALIIILLVGGFILLRQLPDRLAESSEKKQRQREADSVQMNQTIAETPAENGAGAAAVRGSQLGTRLEKWALAERNLRAAEALALKGMNDEAVVRLNQALRAVPDNRAAQQLLMNIYLSEGAYAAAIPLGIRLLDQDSRQREIKIKLLTALRETGQAGPGLKLADQLLEEQPDNITVLETAAAFCMALGDPDRALGLFSRILQNDDHSKAALRGCAEIYRSREKWKTAASYYLKLAGGAAEPAVYYGLALCYAQLQDAENAVVFLGQAATLYGKPVVASWLRDPGFDPVRETVDFRSLAKQVMGIEPRRDETGKTAPAPDLVQKRPEQPDSETLPLDR